MSKKSDEFMSTMQKFFPSTREEYKKSVERFGEVLETVITEDIFMPNVIGLLTENNNESMLRNLFDYFESVSNCEDEHLINLFSVTVLEILGNDPEILDVAKKYMGSKTMQLYIEANRWLGRI